MNDNEFDLTARAWLDDGPTRMSERAVLSALEEIRTTRQRRAVWPAWSSTPGNIFVRAAVAAVLVAAVGLMAVNGVLRRSDGSGVGGPPSPSASAEPTASHPSSPDPSSPIPGPITFGTTFVSPTNGFSFGYLDRGGLAPAKELWDPVTQPFPDFSSARDDPFDVVETGLAAVFLGASTAIPDGVEAAAWIDKHVSSHGCGIALRNQAEIIIDGQSGRISECPNRIDATVVAGGRLYVFILLHDRRDARTVFDAFVATIHLHPEDAAVPSSAP
jgi:hypothetical protein